MRMNNIQLDTFDPKQTESFIEQFILQFKANFVTHWSSFHRNNCSESNVHCPNISMCLINMIKINNKISFNY